MGGTGTMGIVGLEDVMRHSFIGVAAVGCATLAVAVLTLVGVWAPESVAQNPTPDPGAAGLATLEIVQPTPDPRATPYHEGVPAIVSSLNALAGQPAFTADDVRAFLKQHPSMYEDPEHPAAIVSVEFITAKEVRATLEMGIGSPDDALICVVTLKGDFRLPTDDGWEHVRNGTGYVLFDATTGNSLAEGVRPW